MSQLMTPIKQFTPIMQLVQKIIKNHYSSKYISVDQKWNALAYLKKDIETNK
jgi:hypothetical protein